MLHIPDTPPLTLLRDFLLESGYKSERLSGELGLSHTLFANLTNLESLLERTRADARLPVLARLFFAGWGVPKETCRRHIPENVLQLCLAGNVLSERDGDFWPEAVLVPFENFLFACDAPQARQRNRDVVIGPSATTNLLAKAALRTPCESVLDIGTGTGVLAILATRFSSRVTATDVNERALSFARFNAALNGVEGVEFVAGDALAPVHGRRFARILANPPFFLAAKRRFTHSDSPIELDGFTRKLAMEAPQHLEENGVFQMICEWVQVEGESSDQRLRSWTAGSGCDVFVLMGPSFAPAAYAERRHNEAATLYRDGNEDSLSERLNYLLGHGVEYVRSGIFTMRKRTGNNWFTAVSGDFTKGTAVAIQQRMAGLKWLNEHTADEWLAARLRLTPDTLIKQTTTLGENGWRANVQISKADGIEDALSIDLAVLRTIELFDGSRTLQEITGQMARVQEIPTEEAKAKCLSLAKRLLQSGFVMPVDERANQQ